MAATAQAAEPAAISGVVRDAHGTPQMGALVQAIGADAALVGSAFTDIHGRYTIHSLSPGKYQIKATAALFLPTLRENLRLQPGVKSVVNLTLTTLFDAVQWLPAERRKADEPDDDWKWTLRSAANRPILRMLEDGPLVMVSTSNNENQKPSLEARVALISGDGGFADGGLHNVFTIDREQGDGGEVVLRADLASPQSTYPTAPSVDVAAGYERKVNPMLSVRNIVSYQMHPELVSGVGLPGMQALTLQSAQQMQFGDLMALEVGSELTAVRMEQIAAAVHPFMKLTIHPTDSLLVGYRFATARDLQSWDDMDAIQPEMPIAVVSHGQIQMEQGVHQEISIAQKTGRGMIQVAWYKDDMTHPAIAGGGSLTLAAGMPMSSGALADPSTNTFRMLGPGYAADGIRISATEPLTPSIWAALEFATGGALSLTEPQGAGLQAAVDSLQVRRAQSMTVALRGEILHSATHLRAAYRWQPESTLTAVDAFHAFSDQPYLSFYLRQPIHLGRMLPNGVEALVDVTNLLAEGYRPVLSKDGHTLFFAQSPRTIQGGLSFNF
ncbi:MAG: carboxypeptidase-like regulatory domain-containing protein [Acidobacteriaceae bacterium]